MLTRLTVGDWVKTDDMPDGWKGAVQFWGTNGKTQPRKTSRKKAIASGTPLVYVWFHSRDYSEEYHEWVKLEDLRLY